MFLLLLALIAAGWAVLAASDTEPAPPPPEGSLEVTRSAVQAAQAPVAEKPDPDVAPVLVRGVVLSAVDGAPIAGARVSVNPWLETHETVSDVRGGWSLEIPPDRLRRETGRTFRGRIYMQRQRISIRADGFAGLRFWYGVPAGTDPVLVRPVFLRPLGGSVSGRVLDADGAPMPGLPVKIGKRVRSSDADGRFGPEFLPTGEVSVQCRQTAKKVTVLGGEDVEVELVVGRQRFAEGRVLDDAGVPVAGAIVRSAVREDIPVETDEEGAFRWPVPFASKDRIEAVKEGYFDPEVSYWVEGEPIAIRLNRITPLSGRVLMPDGSPGAGLRVAASSDRSEDVVGTYADAEGGFAVGVFLHGSWKLVVMRDSLVLGSFDVEVDLGEAQAGLELRLPEAQALLFEVFDALTGLPIHGVEIRAWPDGELFAKTGPEGRAAVPAMPGAGFKGILRVGREGYERVSHYDRYSGSATVRRIQLRPLGRVRLRVLDAGGEPLPGARISAEHDHLGYSDSEGWATFTIPAGVRVTLEVEHRFAGTAHHPVLPEVGDTMELGDIRLPPPPFDLTIRVVDEDGGPIGGASVEGWCSGPNTSWRTGEDGCVRIVRGDVSSWTIEVAADGFEFRSLSLPGEGEEFLVRLRRCARARGRVLDANGKPVVGMSLWASTYEVPDTDGSGRFEIPGVPAGKMVPVGLWLAENHWGGWGLVVAGDAESQIRFPGTGELVIHVGPQLGEVPSDLELRGVRATILLLDRENLECGGPVKTGGHVLGPCGKWEGERICYTVPAGRILVRFAFGNAGESLLGPVDLAEGGRVELAYSHPPPGTTRVRLLYSDGDPVNSEFIFDAHGGSELAITDEEGWIEPWSLSAYPSGVRRFRIGGSPDAPIVTEPIDMDAGGEVTVRLRPGGGLAGQVYRKDGTPADGARVAVLLPPGPFERAMLCDAEGRFSFPDRVGAGIRTIEVRACAGPPVRREVEVKAGEVTRVRITLLQ